MKILVIIMKKRIDWIHIVWKAYQTDGMKNKSICIKISTHEQQCEFEFQYHSFVTKQFSYYPRTILIILFQSINRRIIYLSALQPRPLAFATILMPIKLRLNRQKVINKFNSLHLCVDLVQIQRFPSKKWVWVKSWARLFGPNILYYKKLYLLYILNNYYIYLYLY